MKTSRKSRRRLMRQILALLLIAGGVWMVIKCEPLNHMLASLFNRAESRTEEAWRRQYVDPNDTILWHDQTVDSILSLPHRAPNLLDAEGRRIKRRIVGVASYEKAFPDLNDVQLRTAERLGVPPQEDRRAIEHMKDRFVHIKSTQHYRIAELTHSVPYLIPRAAKLLDVIGQAFADSLQTKGFEPHLLIVSSVTRTQDDVRRLRRSNGNASENSCHQYGTTLDINYNKFINRRTGETVSSTPLKQILAEVMRDQRALGTCYVKYERHQPCFHFTVR